jgi:hypothetical protein
MTGSVAQCPLQLLLTPCQALPNHEVQPYASVRTSHVDPVSGAHVFISGPISRLCEFETWHLATEATLGLQETPELLARARRLERRTRRPVLSTHTASLGPDEAPSREAERVHHDTAAAVPLRKHANQSDRQVLLSDVLAYEHAAYCRTERGHAAALRMVSENMEFLELFQHQVSQRRAQQHSADKYAIDGAADGDATSWRSDIYGVQPARPAQAHTAALGSDVGMPAARTVGRDTTGAATLTEPGGCGPGSARGVASCYNSDGYNERSIIKGEATGSATGGVGALATCWHDGGKDEAALKAVEVQRLDRAYDGWDEGFTPTQSMTPNENVNADCCEELRKSDGSMAVNANGDSTPTDLLESTAVRALRLLGLPMAEEIHEPMQFYSMSARKVERHLQAQSADRVRGRMRASEVGKGAGFVGQGILHVALARANAQGDTNVAKLVKEVVSTMDWVVPEHSVICAGAPSPRLRSILDTTARGWHHGVHRGSLAKSLGCGTAAMLPPANQRWPLQVGSSLQRMLTVCSVRLINPLRDAMWARGRTRPADIGGCH